MSRPQVGAEPRLAEGSALRPNHGEIGARVTTDKLAGDGCAVRQTDPDIFLLLDYVVGGHNNAALEYDSAGRNPAAGVHRDRRCRGTFHCRGQRV